MNLLLRKVNSPQTVGDIRKVIDGLLDSALITMAWPDGPDGFGVVLAVIDNSDGLRLTFATDDWEDDDNGEDVEEVPDV